MPNYAVVDENNIVKNVIVWDEASAWTPPEGHFIVKVLDEVRCDIGWIHNEGQFAAPTEPEAPAEPTTDVTPTP